MTTHAWLSIFIRPAPVPKYNDLALRSATLKSQPPPTLSEINTSFTPLPCSLRKIPDNSEEST